jgi:hypothetical protein
MSGLAPARPLPLGSQPGPRRCTGVEQGQEQIETEQYSWYVLVKGTGHGRPGGLYGFHPLSGRCRLLELEYREGLDATDA